MGTVNIIKSGKNVNRNQKSANRTDGEVQDFVVVLNSSASARIQTLNAMATIFKKGSNANKIFLPVTYIYTNK